MEGNNHKNINLVILRRLLFAISVFPLDKNATWLRHPPRSNVCRVCELDGSAKARQGDNRRRRRLILTFDLVHLLASAQRSLQTRQLNFPSLLVHGYWLCTRHSARHVRKYVDYSMCVE